MNDKMLEVDTDPMHRLICDCGIPAARHREALGAPEQSIGLPGPPRTGAGSGQHLVQRMISAELAIAEIKHNISGLAEATHAALDALGTGDAEVAAAILFRHAGVVPAVEGEK